MENQVDSSKIAKISAQVSCGSFAVAMFGATSAMATVALPEDTMSYGNIDLTADQSQFYFDISDDGLDDFKISADKMFGSIKGLSPKIGGKFQDSKIADRLYSAGETVDGTASFDSTVSIYNAYTGGLGLEVGQTAYLGLRLSVFGSGYNYGWVEVTRGSITAGSFGYQNMAGMGAPITAPVPLPASLPLLALGAGGLAALRRKRKAS